MATRLAPEERRAEIIATVRQKIAEEGAEDLSMRQVARWCGMSAPGVMHHFETLDLLMDEVLSQRRDDELATYQKMLSEVEGEPTLRDLADITVDLAAQTPLESWNYDRLEATARVNPDHPAYPHFKDREVIGEVRPLTLQLAERDYDEPLTVLALLGLVAEGFRAKWARSQEVPDYVGDWQAIADEVFASLERFRKSPEASN